MDSISSLLAPKPVNWPHLDIDTSLKLAGIIGISAVATHWIGKGTPFTSEVLQLLRPLVVGIAAGLAAGKLRSIFSKTVQSQPLSPYEKPPISRRVNTYEPGIDSVDFKDSFMTLQKQIEHLHGQIEKACKLAVEKGNKKVLSEEEVQISLYEQAERVKIAYEENSRCAEDSPYVNFKFFPCQGTSLIGKQSWADLDENAFQSASRSFAGFEVGGCTAKGRKNTMEDCSIAQEIQVYGKKYPLFGVFDGHGGSKETANCLQKHLPRLLQKQLELSAAEHFPAELRNRLMPLVSENPTARLETIRQYFAAPNSPPLLTEAIIYNALKSTLVGLHELYKDTSGSTANVVFIAGRTCYTANVGDSKSIAIKCNDKTVEQLSEDADLQDPRHQKIVQLLGGSIIDAGGMWRIGGYLGMGSSIGDHGCTGVNPTVDITKTVLPETQETILVLASDGVWNVVTSKQLGEDICAKADQRSAKQLAEDTFYSALKNGTCDNITVIVAKKPASNPIKS